MTDDEFENTLGATRLCSPFEFGFIGIEHQKCAAVTERGWLIRLYHHGYSNTDDDPVCGPVQKWEGPWLFVSQYVDTEGLLKQVMAAFEAYVTHEAREPLTFFGSAVFNPHTYKVT